MPYFEESEGFKLRSGNKSPLEFKQMGSSPAKQHEEIKGTSIFGKSPKDFAKSVGEHALNVVTGGYGRLIAEKLKTSKEVLKHQQTSKPKTTTINPDKPTYIFPTKAKKEGKLMAKMTKTLKPTKRTMMEEIKMKPPYKKPVGPRAD